MFPSTCCYTLIVLKCYRNVFLRKKERERELHFSLDKVQFRKQKVLSDTFFIFITDIVDSYMGKKKRDMLRGKSLKTHMLLFKNSSPCNCIWNSALPSTCFVSDSIPFLQGKRYSDLSVASIHKYFCSHDA